MVDTSPDLFDVFHEAVGIESPAEQQRYLDQAYGGDPQARSRIEALLNAHAAAGGFFGGPVSLDATQEYSAAETLNATIGRYQLREILGSGGMGIVYAAEQEAPLRRQVALKVIKPGMDSREVLARFDAERQALALMDHPGIARVFDAGTTDSGHPYFVMELVRGLSITDYCDRHRQPPADRLRLFITVCQAMQHAHQRGVIHRDLKPSNVLIAEQEGAPVPKVIDFGIAKATTQRLTDQSLHTHQALLLGTPMFMSPEQADLSGVDIDARSDVYALGVLLYELLTGHTPFDKARFSDVPFDELRRIIREDDPPRPSQRVNALDRDQRMQVTNGRSVDERELLTRLERDLDWIVMKALAKDRTRRYESAAALAADLERSLNHQAVSAGPPSFFDRSLRFARRHRLALTSAVILAGLIVPVSSVLSSRSSEQSHPGSTPSPTDELTTPITVHNPPDSAAPASDNLLADSGESVEPGTASPVSRQATAASADQTETAADVLSEPADAVHEAPATIPPLAVFPFEERGSGTTGYGSKITDFLVASLAVNPELIIVERAELNKALDEQKLTASGFVKPDEAVQVGRVTPHRSTINHQPTLNAQPLALNAAAQLAAILLFGVYVLNVGYDFDGTFTRLKDFTFTSSALTGEEETRTPGNRFADTLLGELPVPLPKQFLRGIDLQKRDFEDFGASYLRGESKNGGWWYYYLYGLAVKTPTAPSSSSRWPSS